MYVIREGKRLDNHLWSIYIGDLIVYLMRTLLAYREALVQFAGLEGFHSLHVERHMLTLHASSLLGWIPCSVKEGVVVGSCGMHGMQ